MPFFSSCKWEIWGETGELCSLSGQNTIKIQELFFYWGMGLNLLATFKKLINCKVKTITSLVPHSKVRSHLPEDCSNIYMNNLQDCLLIETEKLNICPLAMCHIFLWRAGKNPERVYGVWFLTVSQQYKFSLHMFKIWLHVLSLTCHIKLNLEIFLSPMIPSQLSKALALLSFSSVGNCHQYNNQHITL